MNLSTRFDYHAPVQHFQSFVVRCYKLENGYKFANEIVPELPDHQNLCGKIFCFTHVESANVKGHPEFCFAHYITAE